MAFQETRIMTFANLLRFELFENWYFSVKNKTLTEIV
jgi:hypothetical protein